MVRSARLENRRALFVLHRQALARKSAAAGNKSRVWCVTGMRKTARTPGQQQAMVAIIAFSPDTLPRRILRHQSAGLPDDLILSIVDTFAMNRTVPATAHRHAHIRQELVTLLPRLRRFAISLARNAADADDLVQEACFRAMSHGDEWDMTRGLDRWVFRILRNLWVSELRKRQVRLGAGHVDVTETEELQSERTGEDDLAVKQLIGRLGALPAGFASVLLLVAVEGYSYKEAADVLDLPQGTVMSRLYRARQMLAEQLAESAKAS